MNTYGFVLRERGEGERGGARGGERRGEREGERERERERELEDFILQGL